MLRSAILWASGTSAVRSAVTRGRSGGSLAARFVAGDTAQQAVETARELVDAGMAVTLDHLGEDVTDALTARRTVDAYEDLVGRLGEAGLAPHAEVSVKLSAFGLLLDEELALANARAVCTAAARAGVAVTVDAEEHATTDARLRVLAALRQDHPDTGGVLQAYLRRTEDDCRALSYGGSRIRLCKGAYAEPESVAYPDRAEIDKAFVRCAVALVRGTGYPMFATHDPRIIAVVSSVVARSGRGPGEYEFQMLYGVRTDEQRKLAAAGHTVRVYLPYGADWYGYLARRIAEKPANLRLAARAALARS